MRQFLFPSLLAAALAVGGCASPEKRAEKQMAKMEQEQMKQNSRAAEERRMHALDYGDVASKRGAEILVYDPNKVFDPSRSGIGTVRPVATGGARTKEFNFDQKTHPGNFLTRAFSSAKSNAAAEKKFATSEANTRGKYAIPAVTADAKKTAATRNLWDGDKVAATQGARDGTRPYLGPESLKMRNAVDAKSLSDWRAAGSESVIYANGTVERVSTLKQLTIDDVRELLNKNK